MKSRDQRKTSDMCNVPVKAWHDRKGEKSARCCNVATAEVAGRRMCKMHAKRVTAG